MARIMNIFITYFCIFNNFCKTTYDRTPWDEEIPIRLIDTDLRPKDIFFDRIVFISMNKANYIGDGQQQKYISLGVFLDDERIITSFNPFRNLIKKPEELEDIRACYIYSRKVTFPDNVFYNYTCVKIICGRPLIPMRDIEILPEQWHDIKNIKHSPLHDLMILRVDNPVELWTPEREYTFEERYTVQTIKNEVFITAGPSAATIAVGDERIDSTLKFAALGLYSVKESRRFINLEAAQFEKTDNVITNCDEWLPRYWGYFICLLNDEKFKGFSSGAMLFSDNKLFGVGSFTMWRGKASIIVFTDVRPYTELLVYTCTDTDLEF